MDRVGLINAPEDVKPPMPNEGQAPATSIFQFAPQADTADGDGLRGAAPPDEGLQLIRLSRNRIIAVAFTMEGTEVQLHYCEESELGGYVQCNGEDCVLCRCGKEVKTMFLIPLYIPANEAVRVLNVSQATTPVSLLPQLQAAFQTQADQWPLMLFLSKANFTTFSVISHSAPKDKFKDHPAISAFMESFQADRGMLASVFSKMDNTALAQVPEIGRVLDLLEGTHADD